jgi:rhodanese-related sulfurtransferase
VKRLELAVLLAVGLAAAGARAVTPAKPATDAEVPRITQEEFKKLWQAKSVVVVDVRGSDAYNSGHIPGAVVWNHAPERFEPQVAEFKASKKTVVTYCTCPAEHSAAVIGLQLIQKGVADVRALKGGLSEWRSTGNAMATGAKPQ